ncbi:DEAD/DEAH box helicase [Salinisphaera sp.]|uniref:DEAD/DEAH box helicase n=1 Tax=Salinisphaera sp. TaxID=1914330 RepID=UPI000C683095|nr:DEAD/DEAH box helicase [Salinisphaera sp.]MAS09945.1 hypothetical protein [Salinisphaera sp.]|tara:strand:+ start:12749 stop:14278 length:1530 start_codon:yes stop_codon:yes gene_type:complete
MAFELRQFQKDAIHDLRRALRSGSKRPVLRLPTGAGKTVVAREVLKLASEQSNNALFLAPRRQLVLQASGKLAEANMRHGVIMAGEPRSASEPLQVVSKDTLHARAIRSQKIELPPADLIIADEAHLFATPSAGQIFDAYPNARVVGLSATPALPNGKGLGNYFDDLVEGPDIGDLIEQGWLVKPEYYGGSRPDMTGAQTRDGEWVSKDIEERANKAELVGDVVTNWLRLAQGRPTVVFAATVAHSRHLRDQFEAAGVTAEHIDGNTEADERDAILSRVRRGETQVITNCAVLNIGWDEPSISCCVIARPTKSIVLFHQMVGRALRLDEGKSDCIVIDHAGAVDLHGFVDEPVEWSLDPGSRVQDRQHERRVENAEPKPITCAHCEFVYTRPTSDRCPSCGEAQPKGREVVTWADAELTKLERDGKRDNRKHTWEEKHAFFGQLLWICAERRNKEGWAKHKYRERYSVWPNDPRVNNAMPYEPTRETRAWVKSRDIAFFQATKSQRRAA